MTIKNRIHHKTIAVDERYRYIYGYNDDFTIFSLHVSMMVRPMR